MYIINNAINARGPRGPWARDLLASPLPRPRVRPDVVQCAFVVRDPSSSSQPTVDVSVLGSRDSDNVMNNYYCRRLNCTGNVYGYS